MPCLALAPDECKNGPRDPGAVPVRATAATCLDQHRAAGLPIDPLSACDLTWLHLVGATGFRPEIAQALSGLPRL